MLVLAGLTQEEANSKADADLGAPKPRLPPKHWSRVESRDAEKTYNLKTFAELKTLAPSIHWDEYLSGLGLTDSFLEWNVPMMPSFFEGLADVLDNRKTWMLLRHG